MDTLFDATSEPNPGVTDGEHAITAALLYVGDLLNGIGYLLTQQGLDRTRAKPVQDERISRMVKAAREGKMPALAVHFVERRDLTPDAVADLLALINVRITPDQVSAWDMDMREQAADYAAAVHLHASDNPDVILPDRPDWLPPAARGHETAQPVNAREENQTGNDD